MACETHQQSNGMEKDATIAKLRQAIADADFERAVFEQEVKRLNQDLVKLQSSTSWRITAPVRKIKALAGSLRRMFLYQHHRITLTQEPPGALENAGSFLIPCSGQRFVITSSRGKMPAGRVNVSGRLVPGASVCLELHIADDSGFSAAKKVTLLSDDKGHIRQLVQLPDVVHGLRLVILDGQSDIQACKMVEMGSAYVMIQQVWPAIFSGIRHPGQAIGNLRKGAGYYRRNGARALFQRMTGRQTAAPDYHNWITMCASITPEERRQIENRIARMDYTPVISVIMPVYNTRESFLAAAIESVRKQLYPHWELCIADDASTMPHVRTILEACKKTDARIKVVYRNENGHISACSNSALALATGAFAALLDHDDKLAPHALYMVAEELNRFPDADIIYSDEDKIDHQGQRFSPHFKPDWNPELLFSINYISHLGVYRTDMIRSVNGFRTGMEGSQDYDLVLRCLLRTTPEKIRHIPHILYHWRAAEGSTALHAGEKAYAANAGIQALKDYFRQVDPDVQVVPSVAPTTYRIVYPVKNTPEVCLVIPTKNNHKMLKTCLDSIFEKTEYTNYRVVIVNNQSDDPDTLSYLQHLDHRPGCRVLHYDHPFNYSAINNFAVENTQSDMVCLVNDDIEVIASRWLGEMVSLAVRPDIGAVGAKLLYPDNRIQHAGVILGIGGVAGHSHKFVDTTHGGYGYFYRLMLHQAISAVTAACLLVRRQVYEQVGGLDARHLQIAFNDVDFCLRILRAGYRNVWTPHALLYHHESVSRGYEDTREKQQRFSNEVQYMQKTWGELLKNDPCYNPNLTMVSEDFALGFPCRAKKPWQAKSCERSIMGVHEKG